MKEKGGSREIAGGRERKRLKDRGRLFAQLTGALGFQETKLPPGQQHCGGRGTRFLSWPS